MKTRGLATPRSSTPLCRVWSDFIAEVEIEVSQRWTLRQHYCKTLCPGCSDVIEAAMEMSQRWALPQHSGKTLCPGCFDAIASEIEVSQRSAMRQHSCKPPCAVAGCYEIRIAAETKVRQRWALRQHSRKPLCIFPFHFTARQLECGECAQSNAVR
jgi:hypothetical protein